MKNAIRFNKFLFIIMILVLFPQTEIRAETSDLILKDAFIIKHPLKGRPSGGYFILTNTGTEACVLTGITASDKIRIDMHETIHENGVMKMVKRDEMVVPAGGDLVFKRGGKHLMIFGITDETEGLSFKFTFKNCASVIHTVRFQGRK